MIWHALPEMMEKTINLKTRHNNKDSVSMLQIFLAVAASVLFSFAVIFLGMLSMSSLS